jgi:DNA helicase-2/ATP-dependent DNA helicase PcrA
LTGHKAKGLEFEYVFLPKCFDGKWGNKRVPSFLNLPDEILKVTDIEKKERNEDARRLFYTALTRAKHKIFISYADTYQGATGGGKILSQFASEINTKYVLDSEFVIQDVVDVAKLQYSSPNELYFNENASEYIKQVLHKSFRMSPTALSTYQTCKRKFLYESILKLPRVSSPVLHLGSAVHKALERLFIYYKQNDSVPTLKWVIEVFDKAISKADISESDFQLTRDKGAEILEGWYNYYSENFKKALYVEFYFGNKDIRYDDVPLTGKIDKIEVIDSQNKTIKVIDYKSGSPKSRNALRGLTQTSDPKVYNQLYFYKLLCDLDPTLQYVATSGEVDFIKPNTRGKFKTEEFVFEEEELVKLKLLITDTYNSMLSLDFSKTDDLKECATCEFKDICRR